MHVQNNLQLLKNEIVFEVLNYSKYKKMSFLCTPNGDACLFQASEIKKAIDSQLHHLMVNFSLGNLGCHFINIVNESYFKDQTQEGCPEILPIWRICSVIDSYINDFSGLRSDSLKSLSDMLKFFSKFNKQNGTFIDKKLIRQVYSLDCKDITDLFKQYFSVPPITLFNYPRIPSTFRVMETKKAETVNEFTVQNKNDPDLEKKITFIQRRIRGNIRKSNEIKRISHLYFNDAYDLALEAIKDADTPYRPAMCNSELSIRIVNAAKQVKLFSEVKHLAAAEYISSILDTCLYGRKNLIDMYMDFRPAALDKGDIQDGDFNVICLGPDLIDSKCLKNRTIGLVLDLDVILNRTHYCNNSAIFFKQRDFGFSLKKIQEIKLFATKLFFDHTEDLELYSPKINLQLFKDNSDKREVQYSTELPKHSFISYNTKDIFQILTLNFFRFIDTLKDEKQNVAHDKIAAIYNDISKLDDLELVNFLTDVGKKMSHTCEFNFSGAYKIDLNALKKIEIYKDKAKIDSFDVKTLIDELNSGYGITWKKLKKLVPEIFESKRFKEYLDLKIVENNYKLRL